MSSFDPTPELRASDADREAAVERLRVAVHEGRLDAEEFELRISRAYDARLTSELDVLTRDVTPPRADWAPPVVPARGVTSGLAIASVVTGFLWFLGMGSLVAVILGHMALRDIRSSNGAKSGEGLAVGGLVLGYGGLAMMALVAVMAAGL